MFTLTLALGKIGDALWRRVGREPSGSAFNSIVQLEHEHGIPRNPFINAGAIVVADVLLAGHEPKGALVEIVDFLRLAADDDIDRDRPGGRPLRSGAPASATRRSPTSCARYGNLDHPPEPMLGVYFHHCAIAMSCRQLALAGRFLANAGRDPDTGAAGSSRPSARAGSTR